MHSSMDGANISQRWNRNKWRRGSHSQRSHSPTLRESSCNVFCALGIEPILRKVEGRQRPDGRSNISEVGHWIFWIFLLFSTCNFRYSLALVGNGVCKELGTFSTNAIAAYIQRIHLLLGHNSSKISKKVTKRASKFSSLSPSLALHQ